VFGKNNDITEVIHSWRLENGFYDYFSLNTTALIPRIRKKFDIPAISISDNDLHAICTHYITEDINRDRSNLISNIDSVNEYRRSIPPFSAEYNMELLRITQGLKLFNSIYSFQISFLFDVHRTHTISHFINRQIDTQRYDIAHAAIYNLFRDKLITADKMQNMLYPFLYASLIKHYNIETIELIESLPYFDISHFLNYHIDNKNSLFHLLSYKKHLTQDYMTLAGYLLKHSVNINAKNSDGRTPLFEAISQNNAEYFSVLLSLGASDKVKGASGLRIEEYIQILLSSLGFTEQNKVDNLNKIKHYYTIHKEKSLLKDKISTNQNSDQKRKRL